MSYKVTTSVFNQTIIFHIDSSSWIPEDESNADYQAYLSWIAEGNTPEPWEQEQ